MRALLLVGLGVVLSGCAQQITPVQAVRVGVPVPVPCKVPSVEVPAFTTAGLKKEDALEAKVRALLAEIKQREGYEKQLVAANLACR